MLDDVNKGNCDMKKEEKTEHQAFIADDKARHVASVWLCAGGDGNWPCPN